MSEPLVRSFERTSGADIAFYVADGAVTRSEFSARVQVISQALVGRARYVINLSTCRYAFALGFAAALEGGLVNLLPANRQLRTVVDVIERYPDCLVLHDGALETDLDAELVQRGVVRLAVPAMISATMLPSAADTSLAEEQLAAIVFTSGSTGEPTAIGKTWGTFTGTTALLRKRFVGENRASMVSTVPPQHMYGLETTVLMSLQGGCAVSSAHPFFPADIVQALSLVPAPRILVTTPIHMKALLRSGVELPALETVISATAPLSSAMATQAEAKWGCVVKEIYGCSEAGSLATRRTATDDHWHMLDGVTLVSRDGRVSVVADYLAEHVELQDQLEVLAPDTFKLLGRGADMLNIAGKRASLGALTAQLQAIEGVVDGVFFVRDDPDREVQRLAALVVSNRTEAEIGAALAELIDPAFMPRPLKKVGQIPRNEVGKIPRALLLQTFGDICVEEV